MQNSGYSKKTKYNPKMSLYVDGNTARRLEEVPELKELTRQQEFLDRQKSRAARQRAIVQQRLIRAAAVAFGVIMMVTLAVTALTGTIRNTELTSDIRTLESDYEKILSQNDSKEYDIDRSVDLNTIIKIATEEYGMVRSSVGQIVTYQADESEYIQQMAELPN